MIRNKKQQKKLHFLFVSTITTKVFLTQCKRVYTILGFAAGGWYNDKGSPTNYLCLPPDPISSGKVVGGIICSVSNMSPTFGGHIHITRTLPVPSAQPPRNPRS